jgi:hypothetical protein
MVTGKILVLVLAYIPVNLCIFFLLASMQFFFFYLLLAWPNIKNKALKIFNTAFLNKLYWEWLLWTSSLPYYQKYIFWYYFWLIRLTSVHLACCSKCFVREPVWEFCWSLKRTNPLYINQDLNAKESEVSSDATGKYWVESEMIGFIV